MAERATLPVAGEAVITVGAEKALRVSKTKRRKLLHRLAQISDSTKKKTQFVHLENDSSDVRAPCVVGIQSITA